MLSLGRLGRSAEEVVGFIERPPESMSSKHSSIDKVCVIASGRGGGGVASNERKHISAG